MRSSELRAVGELAYTLDPGPDSIDFVGEVGLDGDRFTQTINLDDGATLMVTLIDGVEHVSNGHGTWVRLDDDFVPDMDNTGAPFASLFFLNEDVLGRLVVTEAESEAGESRFRVSLPENETLPMLMDDGSATGGEFEFRLLVGADGFPHHMELDAMEVDSSGNEVRSMLTVSYEVPDDSFYVAVPVDAWNLEVSDDWGYTIAVPFGFGVTQTREVDYWSDHYYRFSDHVMVWRLQPEDTSPESLIAILDSLATGAAEDFEADLGPMVADDVAGWPVRYITFEYPDLDDDIRYGIVVVFETDGTVAAMEIRTADGAIKTFEFMEGLLSFFSVDGQLSSRP